MFFRTCHRSQAGSGQAGVSYLPIPRHRAFSDVDEPGPQAVELQALQETLTRSNANLRQKYDTLMATDALASLASGERPLKRSAGKSIRHPH